MNFLSLFLFGLYLIPSNAYICSSDKFGNICSSFKHISCSDCYMDTYRRKTIVLVDKHEEVNCYCCVKNTNHVPYYNYTKINCNYSF